MKRNIIAVILAAGKGTRMKSTLPKVLHPLGGLPLLAHPLRVAKSVGASQYRLVVAKDHSALRDGLNAIDGLPECNFIVQDPPLGTGHALQCALKNLAKTPATLLVLNGDMPLVSAQTLKSLLSLHHKKKHALSLVSAPVAQNNVFGRILRDEKNNVIGSVEYKDASPAQRLISEGNVGIYAIDLAFAQKALPKLQTKNAQKEYYLPDLIALAVTQKLSVGAVCVTHAEEALGVNSRQDYREVTNAFYALRRDELTEAGVDLIGNEIFVDVDVRVGKGTRLNSPCYLQGKTQIAEDVLVETGCVIRDTKIAVRSKIKAHSYFDDAQIGSDCAIGPFAHLRPGSVVREQAHIGNFVELKKTTLGVGAKANHLAYLGDAAIGDGSNIGAGTITCNYDGVNKFQTTIGKKAFIGSDTQLVAPVTVGDGAYVGAGTTVTKNVPANSLAISRVPQRIIDNWAKRKRAVKK